MILRGAWAQSSGGGRASIVVLIAELVAQVGRMVLEAIAGDWSHAVDIFTILVMSWTALMWVWIAAMERGSGGERERGDTGVA